MSEIEYVQFCASCGANTLFLFSASGRRGFCLGCDERKAIDAPVGIDAG